VALVTARLIFWPYLQDALLGSPLRIFWLMVGIGEGLWLRYYLLYQDQINRSTDTSAVYIGIFIIFWVGALFAGNVLREMGR